MALGLLMLFAVVSIGACSHSVERVATDAVIDLSGLWNDTDSRLVANEMIEDLASSQWLYRFRRESGRNPAIVIDKVNNLSHEHINTGTFISDIERALIDSGEVDFVASGRDRAAIRDEKEEQDRHATTDSRKAMGEEQGADQLLSGTIRSIIDTTGDEQVRFYQVDLTLIDIATGRKVWLGQKKIKKAIDRSSLRW